jgi:hypothetical protein
VYTLIDNNTSHINNHDSFYNGIKNDEQEIKGIIADLRLVIDQILLNFAKARDLIQELARRLDEIKHSERDRICMRIKEILKDKIQEGKVTDKWIEECLPKEYKRKYVKSELSSLSKDSPETILVSSNGKTITEPNDEFANDNVDIKNQPTCSNCQVLESEISQLIQALEKNTQLTTAERLLPKRDTKYAILKDKHESKIVNALQKCNKVCYLVFTSDGILYRIEPDTLQESDEEDES